jgi:pyrroloquinoline quinone (PQQ) biosynthesis protein C
MTKEGYTIEARVRRPIEVYDPIESIAGEEFFSDIEKTPMTPAGWRLFVQQKYGSVSYFVDFLKRGKELSSVRAPDIATIFEENLKDEVGNFAGKIRPEYAHEEWRLRSLKHFSLTKEDLSSVELLPEVKEAQEINRTLVQSESFFEVVGALLFWEPFVVKEMQMLILAFERDLPDVFPKNGYDYTKFPLNEQEYWYSHAFHDVWHFKQIREGLQSYFESHDLDDEEIFLVEQGMKKVANAKRLLYSPALLAAMKNAGEKKGD